MPRLRAVLLAVVAAVALPALCLSLPGFGSRQRQLEQEVAKERQERWTAESRTRVWQIRAVVFGSATVLALVVGAALGSRARRDARRSPPHEPQK